MPRGYRLSREGSGQRRCAVGSAFDGNAQRPVAVGALQPLSAPDAAALVVLDLDEPRRLRSGRTVEHHVDVAARRRSAAGSRQPCRSITRINAARARKYSDTTLRHRSITSRGTSYCCKELRSAGDSVGSGCHSTPISTGTVLASPASLKPQAAHRTLLWWPQFYGPLMTGFLAFDMMMRG